jgi:hypothetical protein
MVVATQSAGRRHRAARVNVQGSVIRLAIGSEFGGVATRVLGLDRTEAQELAEALLEGIEDVERKERRSR